MKTQKTKFTKKNKCKIVANFDRRVSQRLPSYLQDVASVDDGNYDYDDDEMYKNENDDLNEQTITPIDSSDDGDDNDDRDDDENMNVLQQNQQHICLVRNFLTLPSLSSVTLTVYGL